MSVCGDNASARKHVSVALNRDSRSHDLPFTNNHDQGSIDKVEEKDEVPVAIIKRELIYWLGADQKVAGSSPLTCQVHRTSPRIGRFGLPI